MIQHVTPTCQRAAEQNCSRRPTGCHVGGWVGGLLCQLAYAAGGRRRRLPQPAHPAVRHPAASEMRWWGQTQLWWEGGRTQRKQSFVSPAAETKTWGAARQLNYTLVDPISGGTRGVIVMTLPSPSHTPGGAARGSCDGRAREPQTQTNKGHSTQHRMCERARARAVLSGQGQGRGGSAAA